MKLRIAMVLLFGLGLVMSACGSDTSDTDSATATADEPGGATSTGDAPAADEAETQTSLPSDFPEEVPLIDGEILESAKVEDGSTKWLVEIAAPDIESTFDGGAKKLESAGFEVIFSLPDPTGSSGTWENASYSVAFEVSETDGQTIASYIVTTL